MPDALFEHPRLVAVHDALESDRGDLEVYADVLAGLGASRVLDLGCGTPSTRRLGGHPAGTRRRSAAAHRVVESRVEVPEVAGPLVTFLSTRVFGADGAVLTSASSLRFRQRAEIEADLLAAGLRVVEVRDAPDRPGRELVFLARRDG